MKRFTTHRRKLSSLSSTTAHFSASGFCVPRNQKGFTLLTAVMFLIVLCSLGVNVAQMSNLEERMAGNTRNRDLAFQAAEAALKHVEQNLNAGEKIRDLIPEPPNNTSGTAVDGYPGFRSVNLCLPNSASYWNNTDTEDCNGDDQHYDWDDAPQPAHQLNQVAEQPKYVVERFTDEGTTERYRVTARGVGGTTDAVVILQALYTFTPSP